MAPKGNLRSRLAPRLARLTRLAPTPLLLGLRPAVAVALFRWPRPSLRAKVERAMAAALGPGGYEPRHVSEYFSHLADLLAFSAAAHRSGLRSAGLDAHWEYDPSARAYFETALGEGKGVV